MQKSIPNQMTSCVLLPILALLSSLSVAKSDDLDLLERSVKSLVDQHHGNVAVAIEFLNSGKQVLINENQVMPTASLIKVAIMAEVYNQVHAGKLKLDDRLLLSQNDKVPGSGILTTHFDDGLDLCLNDAVRLMIAFSDNTATNLVLDKVGIRNVGRTMKSWGLVNTAVNSKVYRGSSSSVAPDRSKLYGLGNTTAKETLSLLRMIHQGQLTSKKFSGEMLDHLSHCEDDSKIRRFLPASVKVANKSGAISHARCDASIISTPSNPAIVVVLTSQNQDKSWSKTNAAEVLCGRIGQLVFHQTNTQKKSTAAEKLSEGDFGVLVESLQRTLNNRLNPSPELSVDGDFGPATKAAVLRFQRANKLATNGIVDENVWKQLSPLLTTAKPVPAPSVVNARQEKKKPADSLEGKPFVTAKAWGVADLKTGKLLFSDHENSVLDIASTTKIMTALLVLELAEKNPEILKEKITFSQTADRTRGSTSGIRAGEILPVSELLYGLMLPSGNDASVALAEHFGKRLKVTKGSEKDSGQKIPNSSYQLFIKAMNVKAKQLQMNDTNFANSHGLTAAGHQSTVSDLIKLAVQAMKLKRFRHYVSTRQHGCTVSSVSGYQRNVVWKNTNQLLAIEGYIGIKTGTTTAAGACLVSACRRDGQELVLVILGSGSSRGRYADSRNLYRWAWRQIKKD